MLEILASFFQTPSGMGPGRKHHLKRSCANDSLRTGWINEQPRKALDPRMGRSGSQSLGDKQGWSLCQWGLA